MSLRRLAIDLTPPLLRRRVLHWRGRGLRFSGRPGNWAEAQRRSTGYDADVILERVATATRAVIDSAACFERDSVLFDEPVYPFELLAVLLRRALHRDGRLCVLDFGGSLGSTYRQCRPLLDGLKSLHWTVVEQPAFVAAGLQEFATEELHFARTVKEACVDVLPDVALASSVLQYVEDPEAVLSSLTDSGARNLLIDRTPLTNGGVHRLCVQHVPSSIYPASYPCWILSRARLLERLIGRWRVVTEFPCAEGRMATDDGLAFEFKGLILERLD